MSARCTGVLGCRRRPAYRHGVAGLVGVFAYFCSRHRCDGCERIEAAA